MEKRVELLKKAYELGFDYEKTYRGCSQCVIAAIQDTLDIRDDSVFKASTGFAGGAGLSGIGVCGAFAGGVMLLLIKVTTLGAVTNLMAALLLAPTVSGFT